MTRGVIGRAVLGVWLGCITATAAQLPPEIMVDPYLLRAERLMEAKDPNGALEILGEIVALQKEHGLTLPQEFHFKHAKVAFSAGEVQEAVDAVHAYLLEAGREGKFYREALELLEEAETEKARVEAETELPAKQADPAPPAPKAAETSGSAAAKQQEPAPPGPESIVKGADYSKCAELFNNPLDTGGDFPTIRNGAFVPDRLRFIPFDLQ